MLEHENGVSDLAKNFASSALGKEWGDFAGILGKWHDLGKYQKEWQKYLKRAAGIETGTPVSVRHSATGALHAQEVLPKKLGKVACYCIASHHRGLYDYKTLNDRLKTCREMQSYREIKSILHNIPSLPDDIQQELEKILNNKKGYKDLQLTIRMLFSCLVDADSLDTELFMNREKGMKRQNLRQEKSQELWAKFKIMLQKKTDSFVADTEINKARAGFLSQCRIHGKTCSKGIYSLHLPTGGGKTLSSIAWALETAERHQLERIFIVLPYTSIITQTSQILRDIFGPEYILEHHSDVNLEQNFNLLQKQKEGKKTFTAKEEEEEYDRLKLLAENWQNVPIIITTNVQFFESLFTNKPSRSRKIHSIANSVLIFDECQVFPLRHLAPMLCSIESLYRRFGTQTLLCTATQPVFNEKFTFMSRKQTFHTIEATPITDVVPYDKKFFSLFNQVEYHLDEGEYTCEELANRLTVHESVLCIVNTRKDAYNIYQTLKKKEQQENCELIHLSRKMCSLHLQEKIKTIISRIKEGKPTKVISTQLIEAGVDLDFPVVYRASTGLDSIIQAGGRCNREGKLPSKGHVYVFSLISDSSQYFSKKIDPVLSATATTINQNGFSINNPESIKNYYRYLFQKVSSFDTAEIKKDLWDNDKVKILGFNFESVQEKFKLIDEKGAFDIFVPYSISGAEIIKKIERNEWLSRSEVRYLQRLKVEIHEKDLLHLLFRGSVSAIKFWGEEKDPVFILIDDKSYSSETGVVDENHYQENPQII
ncbi:CRISPR-associated helicase Cas3' [Porphyromonas macacae]|nr:CRISPR-associated helicase Cas3' [Porphyromonas macacae]